MKHVCAFLLDVLFCVIVFLILITTIPVLSAEPVAPNESVVRTIPVTPNAAATPVSLETNFSFNSATHTITG